MSKIEEFMAKQGKTLNPGKEKKDITKLTAKQRNDLLDKMLKDFGYTL